MLVRLVSNSQPQVNCLLQPLKSSGITDMSHRAQQWLIPLLSIYYGVKYLSYPHNNLGHLILLLTHFTDSYRVRAGSISTVTDHRASQAPRYLKIYIYFILFFEAESKLSLPGWSAVL